MKYLLGILLFVVGVIIFLNRTPRMLKELKRRYDAFADSLQFNEKYKMLYTNRSIITGLKKSEDTIAYNINKGYEIYIAIDEKSDVNSAMYVLLHELAHSTVEEYDHSDDFWKNFKELRELAVSKGLYEPIASSKYCGQTINDSLTSS